MSEPAIRATAPTREPALPAASGAAEVPVAVQFTQGPAGVEGVIQFVEDPPHVVTDPSSQRVLILIKYGEDIAFSLTSDAATFATEPVKWDVEPPPDWIKVGSAGPEQLVLTTSLCPECPSQEAGFWLFVKDGSGKLYASHDPTVVTDPDGGVP